MGCKGKGPPTGAPDCTYTVEDAGEILLDELAGIDDYNEFWNVSFLHCQDEVRSKKRKGPCVRNTEYSGKLDQGIGNSFWNGRLDKKKVYGKDRESSAALPEALPKVS